MPRGDDWTRLAQGMSEDPRTRILGTIFILGGVLVKIGVIGYILNSHNKAFYYVMLSGVAAWILLLCCGWTVRSSMNFCRDLPSFLCFCLILVVYLGIATGIVIPLLSEYNRDNKVSFNVNDANLAQFSLSSNTNMSGPTLDYNLTVKVVVGPNRKKQGVYYGKLQAWASYQGHNFTTPLSLPPFSLGGKSNHTYNSSTVVLQPLVFQDQLVLPPDVLKLYQQDESAGRFSIDVTLSHEGFRGHHQLKGVDTFALDELPLPNVSSGWLHDVGSADAQETVVGYIVGLVICILILSCCLCWGCNAEERDKGSVICCSFCMLLLLIQIAIIIPLLVRALKTPDQVRLRISDATLTKFNFPSTTINSTLAYNLSLAITIGPNKKKTGVYFDKMEAVAYYQGHNFTSLPLSPLFLQGQQQDGARTIILHPVFQGQQVLVLTGDGLKHYQKETLSRRYSILVTLSYSGIRTDDAYNSGGANGTSTMEGQLKGVASFELKVPLLASEYGGELLVLIKNWVLTWVSYQDFLLMVHFSFDELIICFA